MTLHDTILSYVAALTDEERQRLFVTLRLGYCAACGVKACFYCKCHKFRQDPPTVT